MVSVRRTRTAVLLAAVLLVLAGSLTATDVDAADPAEVAMTTGLKLLNEASAALMDGDKPRARALTEAAIKAAPRLGAARSILAGMLMQDGDFRAAEKEYRAAVALIEEPDQPRLLLPFWGPAIPDPEELAGDAYATWGFCLVELAKAAHAAGDRTQEEDLLKKAKTAFTASLKRKPSPEMRAMSEDMLLRFNF